MSSAVQRMDMPDLQNVRVPLQEIDMGQCAPNITGSQGVPTETDETDIKEASMGDSMEAPAKGTNPLSRSREAVYFRKLCNLPGCFYGSTFN